jgi:hypothetical protein
MKIIYSWIPEEIRSYKALYKGRKYWVFENDFERPYDGFNDVNDNQYLVYDASIDTIIAVGGLAENGLIHGWVTWGQGVDFYATDAADMVAQILSIAKWYY